VAIGLKGLALADLTCCWLFSCCLRRVTEYHSNERRTLRIFRHFCTSSRILSCHEPCFLAPVACLLPLAISAFCICCCCLPCKNQAQGRSGLEVILGRVLSNQFLGWFGRSLEHESASFTSGKNPHWGSAQWVQWVGWRPRLLYALAFLFLILQIINFQLRLNPSLLYWERHPHRDLRHMRRQCWPQPTCRSQPSNTMSLYRACDHFYVHPLPCLHVNGSHLCKR